MTALDCPGIDCIKGLLSATLSPDQREQCERHLESCAVCQAHLDRADEAEELVHVARQVGDPTTVLPDPTLVEVMDSLRGTQRAARPVQQGETDLYFLSPSDQPGVLGTLGAYEVQEVIGQGGMGVVLKAYEPALQRHVAIKVLAPALAGSATARKRFTREAQTAAAVCHEHIVAVHGVKEDHGLPYLVMQLVPGESLQERLDREGPLDVIEVVRIGMQAASALQAAHAQGLIHRDVKPANLLLENGLARVKITDFGLARMADDVVLTQQGVVAGTPAYMAPEQARGEAVDARSDLFSLGCVLYAMCTGLSPFRGGTALSVVRRVCDQEPPAVRLLNPEVPAWLEAFIARLMAKDPARRFQSAAEVADLLESYLAHLREPMVVPAPQLPPLADPVRSTVPLLRFWLPTLLTAVGLSGALLAWMLLLQEQPPAKQSPPREVYQDFRGARPLLSSLAIYGPDVADVIKPEAEGLRVTLPGTRPAHRPLEVATKFSVSGDFEITGTYEILSATRPAKGYGVGVSINVADDSKRSKFAKIGRLLQAREGSSGYMVECWNKDVPNSGYVGKPFPSEAKSGQLRLIREGSTVRYLVSDGPGTAFRELYQGPFVPDDLAYVRFQVVDSGWPGHPIDARLVDLRVRTGAVVMAAPAEAVPAVEPEPQKAVSKPWLLVVEVIALGVILAVVGVGVWLYARRRSSAGSPAGGMALGRWFPSRAPAAGRVSRPGPLWRGKRPAAHSAVRASSSRRAPARLERGADSRPRAGRFSAAVFAHTPMGGLLTLPGEGTAFAGRRSAPKEHDA